MELAQLRAFERAAREGSFTRAAEALDLTQPTVSTRIAGLEADLGGPLFERGRRLKLTALGECFLPYVVRALDVLAAGCDSLADLQCGRSGTISIAALTSMMTWMLPEAVARFRREYPQVDVRVTPREHGDIPAALYDGVATMGISGSVSYYYRNLEIIAQVRVPIHPLAAADHPLARRQAEGVPLYVEDLYAYTMVRVNLGPKITNFVENLIEYARQQHGIARFSLPALMAPHFVLYQQAIAFLPEGQVKPHLDAGTMVRLTLVDAPANLSTDCHLVVLRGRAMDERSTALVRSIRAQWRHMGLQEMAA
jgi:DNA-binding transcriptional LysR family regulator